jgi:hypothetical protein
MSGKWQKRLAHQAKLVRTYTIIQRRRFPLSAIFSPILWWCGLQPLKWVFLPETIESRLTCHSSARTHCTRMHRTSSPDVLTAGTCSCARRVEFKLTKSSEPALPISRPWSSHFISPLRTPPYNLYIFRPFGMEIKKSSLVFTKLGCTLVEGLEETCHVIDKRICREKHNLLRRGLGMIEESTQL